MTKFIRYLILAILVIFSLTLSPTKVSAATGDILNTACGNASDPQYNSPTCIDARNQIKNGGNPVAGPNGIIQTAATIIALVVGIVAVVMIIVGGIQYATAGGAAAGQRAGDDPTKAKNARQTIINALIGLIVTALAWTIASFVIQHIG